jgi:hypothetical protein
MSTLPKNSEYFVEHLKRLGRQIRDTVLRARKAKAGLAGVARHSGADTIYQIDAHVDPVLEKFCQDWARELPLALVAEGFHGPDGKEGTITFPHGTPLDKVAFYMIVDPIDGTRGIMYDKRAAWVLAGVAPNLGTPPRLCHIEVAMQCEIPTSKQYLADVLWAVRGQGAHGQRDDLLANKHQLLTLQPSTADTLAHGFAMVSSFFPGTKRLAADLMEEIVEKLLGPPDPGKALVFDDQYISTGGQFYEMIVGHDRFNADLRPLFYQLQNQPPGLCCHPYDCAAALIAQEAGVIVTDGLGDPLDGPFDTDSPISFAAFANQALREKIEPLILDFLLRHGLN